MNVFVTGGAGFVGSHACKALAQAGHVPVSYDNLSRGHRDAVRWGPFEDGDLRDVARTRAALRRHAPAAVLHFAGYIAAGESVEQPQLYHDVNVGGSMALLEAMRAENIPLLVFSSTAGVYGAAAAQPLGEDTLKGPASPYAASKLEVERLLADPERAPGLRSLSLRYFNAAGADPDGELGECHEPETHLIPLALEAAAGRREALHLYGDDYPTADGTCVRDYVHVSDLAAAHVLALQRLLRGGDVPAALNLGTGQGHSVAQVIAAIERVTGRRVPVQMRPRRPGDSPELVADARRARSELGWTPRYPRLETMIEHAWAWLQRRG